MRKLLANSILILFQISCQTSNVNQSNIDLINAAKKGDIVGVEMALTNGADVNYQDKEGQTPLMIAVNEKNYKMADFLISKKPNLNNKDKDQITPLIRAVINNDIKMVIFLLINDADISIRDKNGKNAYDWAKMLSYKEINAFLKSIHEDSLKKSLYDDMVNRDYDSFISLVRIISKYEYRVDYSEFLPKAVELGELNFVKYFVDNGYGLEDASDELESPICIACANGYLEIVEYLVKKGADVHLNLTPIGFDLLSWSVINEQIEISEYLIRSGIDVNHIDNDGSTPLHYAVSKGNLELVKLLVENGSDLSIVSKKGGTPLNLSLKEEQKEITAYLESVGGEY